MNDLHRLLEDLPDPDESARRAVAARAASVIRPAGALERLDAVAIWLAGWQRTATPAIARPAAAIFVADHGVTREGVSAYPADVTRAMLEALRDGAATATVWARYLGVALETVDVGVGQPTGDIRLEPALSQERFQRSVGAGREAVARRRCDLSLFGEMGIGNTTAAAAVCSSLFGGPVAAWVGRGTGIDDETLSRKIRAVERAADRIREVTEPVELLRQVGGAELAAIAGAIVEARRRSIPVLLDGFVVCAAAAVLEVARPGALDHCLASHSSDEAGHAALLERLGKPPLLDLGLRLGEGSGALAALPLVRLAAAGVTEVATFAERRLGT
jgi:nicotinate-nucleotide--dimethylbenzimidazole phosphoribosyltransferase